MKTCIVLLSCLFISVLLLAGCKSQLSPETPATVVKSEEIGQTAIKQSWEMEWAKITQEARKEGKVVLYTEVGPELRIAFIEAMKEYGIALEIISGRGAEMAEKIVRERKSGIYSADLYISGLSTIVNVMKPAGALAPMESLFILPEVKDPKLWYEGKINFSSEDKQVFAFIAYLDHGIHVNTDIVKPGDITSMKDLLSSRWKGKIIMDDPTVSGRGNNWMSVVSSRLGKDYIKQLVMQEPLITRDIRQLTDWVAKGRYPVGLGLRPDTYQEYKRAGAPITNLYMEEVSYLLAGIGQMGYLDKAPHPNASRVFLNWLLSKKGQTIWQESRMDQSARIDTPIDHLEKAGYPVRKATGNYFDVRKDTWELGDGRKAKTIIVEVFSPLLK